jgi:hypothetical protein
MTLPCLITNIIFCRLNFFFLPSHSGDHEERYFLDCNAEQSSRNTHTFKFACRLFLVGYLIDFLFDIEDGESMFLRNVELFPGYKKVVINVPVFKARP